MGSPLPDKQFSHVSLEVSSISGSVRFFTSIFSFREIFRAGSNPENEIWLHEDRSKLTLHLVLNSQKKPVDPALFAESWQRKSGFTLCTDRVKVAVL